MNTRSSQSLALIIPAHNEAQIIAATLRQARQYVTAPNIYVVDDGSRDKTAQIARKFTHNVVRHPINLGKGSAINTALDTWHLPEKYAYIMPLDADTTLTPNFFKAIHAFFKQDVHQDYVCLNGRVVARQKNWLTAYRIWEYEIAQTIHKTAQSIIGGIVISPGCATVYRSAVFKKVQFPTHSLAEDMDLTFTIHRKRLGKIGFVSQAEVITQDPSNLSDYINQIDRWYTGLWHNIRHHNVPWEGQMLDFEVALLATEALFSGLLYISFLVLLPLSLTTNIRLFLIPLIIDMCLFILPTVLYTAIRRRVNRMVIYLGHFYFLRLISSVIFLRSFVKVMFDYHRTMRWFSPHRYQLT